MILILQSLCLGKTLHQVNSVDLNGNKCPPLTRYDQICPIVCAQSINECPIQVRPKECPSGQFYCGDGSCRAGSTSISACIGVANICSCSHGFVYGSGTNLIPCLSGQKTNVTSETQNVHNGDAPLVAKCAQDLGLSIQNPTNPLMLQCRPGSGRILSFAEPEFLVFYTVLAAEFLILIMFYLYKSARNQPPAVNGKSTSMFADGILEMEDVAAKSSKQNNLIFVGYKRDLFGEVVYWSIWATSALWIALFMVLILDYYEVFSRFSLQQTKLLFIDHTNLSRVFVALWHLALLWFIGLILMRPLLKTCFLMKAPLTSCPDYVLIKKKVPPPIKYQGLGYIVDFVHRLEKPFRKFTKNDTERTMVPVKWTDEGALFVEFECVRYVYDRTTGHFEPFDFKLGTTNKEIHSHSAGLSSKVANQRLNVNGPNQIIFEAPAFMTALFEEFTGIFYLYQIMMLIIWLYYAYYYMAIVLLSVIIGSGVVKVVVAMEAQKRVIEMATYSSNVECLRNSQWTMIDSTQLVPGDVIKLQASTSEVVSVDCVLLSGDVVVDESSLTGEALPVLKTSLDRENAFFSFEERGKRHGIYAGCHILETQPENINDPVFAFVLATGAGTLRGKLVRDILYPAKIMFGFIEELKLVIPILLVWGIIMLFVSMGMLEIQDIDSWFYGMFTISQILSPLLPAVLVIGQSISAQRLLRKGIMCVDLTRITLAAKISVFCFDKTGTMTKEGLEFVGSQEINQSTQSFQAVRQDFSTFSNLMKMAMLTCHSLSIAGGQIVGNFVDTEMFKATKASIDSLSPSIIHPLSFSEINTLEIVKRFEFAHSHAYMSVVCRDKITGKLYVFLKALVGTHPSDYVENAEGHSRRGCYIVAFAFKELSGVSLQMVQNMERFELESGCQILGFNLFRNELKPDTRDALKLLRQGAIRPIMITGDHALTAVYIGQESGLIQPDSKIYILNSENNNVFCTDYSSNRRLELSELESMLYDQSQSEPIELVVTGAAFRYLSSRGWIQSHLQDIRIFARMNPDDKLNCVRIQMAQNITAMCGDGGNDAGALKQAHVGLAISDAEASVVAHFSSRNRSLMCCVEMLREARCSLDVGFAAYKYLLIYGETLAFSGIVQYYFNVNMSQATWIMIDGSTVPVSWALTLAKPAEELSSTRPTGKLLGIETVASVLGAVFFNTFFIIILVALMYGQSFFVCHEFDGTNADLRRWWELADNYEGAITSVLVMYQILHASAAFNIGSKYRRGGFGNIVFIICYTIIFSIITCVLMLDPNWLSCHFRINCGTPAALSRLGYSVPSNAPSQYFSASGHNVIPLSFRWITLCVSILNLFSLLLWEGIVILGPVRNFFKNTRWNTAKPKLRL